MPGFNIKIEHPCLSGSDTNAFRNPSSYAGPSSYIETARAHRYKLEILNFSLNAERTTDILLYLSKCTRPNPEIDEITIHNGQDEIYRPGKNRWQPIKFTFYEVLNETDANTTPSLNLTASNIFNFWANKTVLLTSSRLGAVRNDSRSAGYYSDAQLDMLNGVGQPIWTYELHRCWPTSVSPQDLAYSETSILETTVTMRFDRAFEKGRI